MKSTTFLSHWKELRHLLVWVWLGNRSLTTLYRKSLLRNFQLIPTVAPNEATVLVSPNRATKPSCFFFILKFAGFTLHRMFHVTMSLSHKIESSHQKPLLLPLPAFAQQVFSQQSRLSSIQRRRYLLPLLPSLFRLTQDKYSTTNPCHVSVHPT